MEDDMSKTTNNRCLNCGTNMVRRRENRRHLQELVGGVTLVGVDVYRCPRCGEEEVAIPRIEELHRVIATTLATRKARLTPGEIRFLRTYLGLSSVDFARRMGVTKETVSRWERKDAPLAMKVPIERLLRLMVLFEKPVKDYPLARLDETATEAPHAEPLRLTPAGGGWRRAA
jgi:putative zinc finger/helix-turn-helix YgiT family protein